MAWTVQAIAERLDGVVEGEGAAEIHGVAGLREAEPGELSFLAHPRYQSWLAATQASAVLVARDWAGVCPCAAIRVEQPEAAFAEAAAWWAPPPAPPVRGIHPTAILGQDAQVAPDAGIGPFCVLGDGVRIGAKSVVEAHCVLGAGTVIGEQCHLYPLVSTREGTRIGNRTVIHNGAVLGSDGFGYERTASGWKKIPQIGIVVVGDDVEIGANVTIDRARFGRTVIGNGVKLDNLVQVAHNCRVGDNAAIAAQVGLAGSALLGAGVQFGGQAGCAGHLRVGDGAVVAGRGGVTKDVPAGEFVSDFPAIPHAKARRLHAHVARLPAMKKTLDALEARLRALEQRSEGTAS